MFVHLIVSSCIVASAFASYVPNPCLNGGTYIARIKGVVCKCAPGWDGPVCSSPFRYLGCYEDKTRVMNVTYPDSTSNSPLECASRCRDFTFGGVQFGKGCVCGKKLPLVRKPESDCNVKCPGDKIKKCGGKSRISVYSNRDCSSLPNPTNGAVSTNGTHQQSVATYTCSAGFKLSGVSTRACVLESGWSDVAPTCVAGKVGDSCATVTNLCANLINAPCTGGKCTCLDGYTQSNDYECTDINECDPAPCINGGTCNNEIANFTCTCATGYTGAICEININECSFTPCQNGGTCNGGVKCSCPLGYTGNLCETDVIQYLGCYNEMTNSQFFQVLHAQSPLECASRCFGWSAYTGFRMTGYGGPIACYCSNVLITTPLPESECFYRCHMDRIKHCGGAFTTTSIYKNFA